MKAKIRDKREIAKGTLMVEFRTEKDFSFKPGQFFFIRLKHMPYSDERGDERHFSFVNTPNHEGVIQMATRITDSAFKKSLKELPLGAEVEIDRIMGEHTLPDDNSRRLVFIAGGIGITPYMSMLRYVREKKLDYKITLVYSSRDKESTAFYEELKSMAGEIPGFKLIMTMTNDDKWRGETRRVSEDFIKEYFPDYKKHIFMFAGPPGMVEAVTKVLKGLGIGKDNIRPETFTGY